jgi:uncharacterized protein (DUF305 family)
MKYVTSTWSSKCYMCVNMLLLSIGFTSMSFAQAPSQNMAELESLFFQRVQESKMRFVQADVDFMTHMIPHHSQALIMSRLAPQNGASRQVQTLAARIINAQADEIFTMQTWLRDRSQPVPIVHIDELDMTIEMEMPKEPMDHGDHHASMNMDSTESTTMDHSKHLDVSDKSEHSMHQKSEVKSTSTHDSHSEMGHEMTHSATMDHSTMDHSAMDHSNMPGMLSPEQLQHLASVKGVEFDKAFLTYMIGHHEGAIYMVNDMFAADGAGNDEDAYRLAVDIYAEQITEIAMMKLMLKEIDATVEVMTPNKSHHNH